MFKSFSFLLLFSLSLTGPAFAKELSTLFEVKIPADQYTNTNDGLNKAFNRLIKKLTGSRTQKYLWRIGNAKLKKVDFVSSYSLETNQGQEMLTVQFNSTTLIPQLRGLNIPLLGFNRPVILFLLKLDAGEAMPKYLSSNTSGSLEFEMIQMLKIIGIERGVYLELPEFDLEDLNLLNHTNVLFSPSQYVKNKFYHDAFLNITVSRVGINQWAVDGDVRTPSPLQKKMLLGFIREQIHLFLDKFLEVKPLETGLIGDEIIMSIHGLDSFEDFMAVELELGKIFAIKERNFFFFNRSQIDYKIQLFQTTDSLLKELRGSSKLMVENFNIENQKLKLEYLN